MAAIHVQMSGADMIVMHAQMSAARDMRRHRSRFGIDPDEMSGWMARGHDWGQIHAELAGRGIGVEQMLDTCPMAGARASLAPAGTMADGAEHGRHHP